MCCVFFFSTGGKIGNTLNSHRLVEWSKLPARGGGALTDKLINTLFEGYFEQQADIADIDTLADIAVKAGVASKEDAINFLKGEELKKEVLTRQTKHKPHKPQLQTTH